MRIFIRTKSRGYLSLFPSVVGQVHMSPHGCHPQQTPGSGSSARQWNRKRPGNLEVYKVLELGRRFCLQKFFTESCQLWNLYGIYYIYIPRKTNLEDDFLRSSRWFSGGCTSINVAPSQPFSTPSPMFTNTNKALKHVCKTIAILVGSHLSRCKCSSSTWFCEIQRLIRCFTIL